MANVVGLVLIAVALATGCMPRAAEILHPPNLRGDRVIQYAQHANPYQLQNGMNLLLLPDDKTNLVKVDVRYRVGAAEDPPGKAGLAHLVEHMTYRLRTADDAGVPLAERLNDLALYYNAYTIWDETHYTAIGFPDDLPALLALEAERLRGGCARITEDELAHEREIVRNEIRARAGPGADTYQALRNAVYGKGHAYERSIGGTDIEVAAITRADVCAFMAAHYVPERAILVISGKVNSRQVAGLVSRDFSTIAARPGGPRKDVARPRPHGSSSRHALPVEEATALIVFATDPFHAENTVYEQLLVETFARRMRALQEEHAFLTSTAIGTAGGVQAPVLVVALSVKEPGQLDRAVQLFFDDVQAFVREELDDHVLTRMREGLRASLLFRIEPFMREASIVADYVQYANSRDLTLRDLQLATEVSAQALQRWGKTLFRREASHVLYIQPDPGAEAIEERAALTFSPKADAGAAHRRRAAVDPAAAAAPLDIPELRQWVEMRRFTVNGLNVILVPALDHQVVDIRMVFPAGSLHEPADQPGVARMALELLEPSEPLMRTSRDQFFATLMLESLRMGGDLERSMDERTTTFRMTGLGIYLDALLWNLHWLLENGHYSKETLKQMREFAARHESARDEPERRWARVFLETLFGAGHPYASQGMSLKESLERLSIGDLERFRDAHYRLRGATLIVSGRFDGALAEDEIRRLYAWDERPRGPGPRPVPAAARRGRPHYLAAFDDSVQTEITIAFDTQPGFVMHHAGRLVLREMMEDRLSVLREELGAAYGVSVAQVTREGPGLLRVSAAVDRERAGEAFVALQSALAALRAGDITADFARARRQALRHVLADSFHSQSVAGELELVATYELPATYYAELARRVATLRPADIQALIARELDLTRQVVFVRGRRASVEALYRAGEITGYRVLE